MRLAILLFERRGARFVCVVALVDPSGHEQVVEGELHGRIAEAPAGGGGFGYDPVFYVPEVGKTLAELKPEEKNRIKELRGEIRAHHRWWFDHLPRVTGGKDGVAYNWWRYIIDPNTVR